ncbi:hypothetical protein PR003_g12185 [Phytophthora rubi]|uniref:RxLR effector protein n=1 Tax=Phytophthora rubi TaxID=129364 RepID=A0A6A3MDB1_9STRA|nr:hypothetical protein PR002_g11692 [Phytophthora rubi]KAE9029486.1 hypothetical protein PR001_g11502 [Phytophthora rubi]KAE9337067.1 hypothetical protein PR003_g12185 [Phytophthora rubi]
MCCLQAVGRTSLLPLFLLNAAPCFTKHPTASAGRRALERCRPPAESAPLIG